MEISAFSRNSGAVRGVFATLSGLAAVLMISSAPMPARAAGAQGAAPAATPTFGSVNVDQVLAESNARKKDQDEMGGMLATLRRVNANLAQGTASLQQGAASFLSDVEMRELAGLYEKDQPNETERKRIAALESLANGRKAELAKIESTPQPTDENRRRFTELGNMRQQGDQNLQQLTNDLQERLRKREEELTTKTIGVIRDAIAAVAKTKGLTVVFDNKVAIYTNNDITADVVKQVNK